MLDSYDISLFIDKLFGVDGVEDIFFKELRITNQDNLSWKTTELIVTTDIKKEKLLENVSKFGLIFIKK